MAKRPAWSVQDDVVICENFDFMWSGGFSITQKQKNIRALHQSIYEMKHEKAVWQAFMKSWAIPRRMIFTWTSFVPM